MTRRLRAVVRAAAAAAVLATAAPTNAAPTPEYRVKAAFIYNFIRFVEWPEGARGPAIRVGVSGPENAYAALRSTLDDREVGDRKITVERLLSADAAKRFDVIYVAGNDHERARQIVAAAAGRPVLTVTECDRFLTVGSLINFYISESTIRFAVNATFLERSQLTMSSQMLQFAAIVRTGG